MDLYLEADNGSARVTVSTQAWRSCEFLRDAISGAFDARLAWQHLMMVAG